MNNDIRNNFLFVFFGHNRTGKTQTALEIIKGWKQTHKGMVYTFDNQGRYNDIRDKKINLSDSWEKNFLNDKNIKNSLLVIDDYRILCPSNTMSQGFLDILNIKNEYCIDIIIITHAPGLIIERLTYFITHYFLFYTQSTAKGFKDRMSNYETVYKLKDIINEYVKKHGRGDFPIFPYIIFDNETEKINFINMPLLKL